MRLGGYRTSDNVRDQGQGGGGLGFGGGGGGGGGCLFALLPMVLSRFGIGGVLILLLGYCALSYMGGGGGLGLGGSGPTVAPQQQGSGATDDAAEACAADEPAKRFSCQVLASTEDTWARLFSARGQSYQPAGFRFYGGSGNSGCGAAQSAMGPFYCPTDNNIYLDTGFYQEMQTKLGADGDFAQAYVIAHEVGHHIQNLTGVLDQARAQQRRVSSREGNAVQVRVELQADCYAGVWAANARDSQGSVMEPGDLEEGLRAAQAIGDDTLQRKSQGRVVPESFTHGSAAQRTAWLRRGYESGDPAVCDTFTGAV
ncbi:MAG: neutral zinc metallopeptidase [Allosphingosinicella sp.]